MAITGMKWNEHAKRWLLEWDGQVLLPEADIWMRRGMEEEAACRTKVRKASSDKVRELMDTLEAMEEHWDPKTPGDMLTRIVRIFVTELTPQDKAEIAEAVQPDMRPTWRERFREWVENRG